jgi:hypothetical protein
MCTNWEKEGGDIPKSACRIETNDPSECSPGSSVSERHENGNEGGGFPKSASRIETNDRGKGSKTNERTGESRDTGLKTNANPKTSDSGERSWRLARCGRFRVNGARV